mgnify:CR=1 FL=1
MKMIKIIGFDRAQFIQKGKKSPNEQSKLELSQILEALTHQNLSSFNSFPRHTG